MLAISPNTNVFVYTEQVDFRKGIDGLQGVCRKMIEKDPFSGTLFLFFNRRRNAIRLLCYDGQGFWLCTKRLSKGTFQWFPKNSSSRGIEIEACDLQTLIWNGNPDKAHFSNKWKNLT